MLLHHILAFYFIRIYHVIEPNNASSASRRSTRSRISLGRENTAEQEKQGYAQTSQIIAPTHNEGNIGIYGYFILIHHILPI